jgi:folate-binding protein YgfZ
METLKERQIAMDAVFVEGSPLPQSYGADAEAYRAAHEAAVLIDRSDEGRVQIEGPDRLKIVHRISTNAVESLAPGEGRATVLTTPIGRIIDRVILHNLDGERTLTRTSAGRGTQIAAYLRRNIFFRDRMQVIDRSAELATLTLYGPSAGVIAAALLPDVDGLALHHVLQAEFEGASLLAVGLDPMGLPGIGFIVPQETALSLWEALLTMGRASGLCPAGLRLAEVLRIEAGRPGPAGELNEEYIPLEAALWSDVSFTKGCYAGQEIIARMESRGRLAKTLVGVSLAGPAKAGTAWEFDGRRQGMLTSVICTPDGRWIGLGFVKPDIAEPGRQLTLEDGETAVIVAASGGPPDPDA